MIDLRLIRGVGCASVSTTRLIESRWQTRQGAYTALLGQISIPCRSPRGRTKRFQISHLAQGGIMAKFDETDIFVSHSSDDQLYADALVQALTSAIDLDTTQIVCTSVVGHRLAFGKEFEGYLRAAISASEVLIPLVSKKSLSSLFCSFEMGAAWGLKKLLLPILLPGLRPSMVGRPLSSLQALSWRDELGWIQFITEVAKRSKNDLKAKPEQLAALAKRAAKFRPIRSAGRAPGGGKRQAAGEPGLAESS